MFLKKKRKNIMVTGEVQKAEAIFPEEDVIIEGCQIVIEEDASFVVNLVVSPDLMSVKQDKQKRGILLITMVKYHNA